MSNSQVPIVYKGVIDDVIEKMSQHFLSQGLDHLILNQLSANWEQKLIQLNVADFQQQQQPQDSTQNSSSQLFQGNPYLVNQDLFNTYAAANMANIQQSINQQVQQGAGNNSNGFNITQNDGQDDETLPKSVLDEIEPPLKTKKNKNLKTQQLNRHEIDIILIKQLDGNEDGDDDSDEDEEEDLDQNLGSDLDDSDDSDDSAQPVDHLILCQYEKVTRIKTKWKCVLKDGIVNVNGRDFLFNKANGDFEW
ncbi:transcription factor IIA subunit alpha [Lobulomyces angularis]|nr:transcription factor IIA subunit alpha [Lobulomyces angularis]